MALFDVLMPVKNGDSYIESAIASIKNQTKRDWRLLVLDHGSTDKTVDVVAALAERDARIELRSFPDAAGLSGLLNAGLALVTAPYTLRMDADDESLPDRMALTEAAFQSHPGVVVVGGQADVIDKMGRHVGYMRVPCDTHALARTALFRNPLAHPTVTLLSRAVADQQIRYGESLYCRTDPQANIKMPSLAEDYLLFGELACAGLAVNINRSILRYRYHAAGVSRSKLKDQLVASAMISRHLAGVLSRQGGLQTFDPVPFCSHGATLISVGATLDYREHYETMRSVLRRAGAAWHGGEEELRWRGVFVDRAPFRMWGRALIEATRSMPSAHEYQTLRNASLQLLRGRPMVEVEELPRFNRAGS